jgi:hypothetical protein
MEAALARRVDELVELGWEPQTTTETTASLVGRRPFSWWLFLLVVVFFPIFGGILYLIFWLASSRAVVFLHQEGEGVVERGDTWLIREQGARREVLIKEQRHIREQGFWAVMWPKLVVFLGFLVVWGLFLKWLY